MRNAFLAGIVVGAILAALPAQGTVIVYLNTKELTQRAAVVIQGTVVVQEVVKVDGHLWTDSHVRVDDSLVGKVARGKVVVVRQPGGETATLGERVSGAAQFRLTEKVLVFARKVKQVYMPLGMSLGKYSIYRDARGIERVRRDLSGVGVGGFDPEGRFAVRQPLRPPVQDVPLTRLVEAVRDYRQGGAR
jgi:hypothetical protein